MKKIFLIIFTLTIILCLPSVVKAQTETLSFVVVSYETREDLDVLFANSTRVLEYLEGREVESPLFLALVNSFQNEYLVRKNFKLKVIDPDVQIERYVLLYHPLAKQSEKLMNTAEEVIPISNHYTIIRLFEGKEFAHLGKTAEFFDIPFSEVIVTPPLRTKTAIQIPTIKPNISSSTINVPEPTSTNIIIPLIIIMAIVFCFLVAGSVIFFLIYRRRKRNDIPSTADSQPPMQ